MIEIEASILAADYAHLGQQARAAQEAGVDGLQIDVMDGCFVPPITFGPGIVRALRREVDLFLDVDLMIVRPEHHVQAFADAGADRLIVHRESTAHPYRVLRAVRDLDVQVGIAIAPGTALGAIEELLALVDLVQVMTVSPGWGGQSFLHDQLDKIRRLRRLLDERALSHVRIGVDGGIDPTTAPLVVQAGARVLVAGSAIYSERGSVGENVAALRGRLHCL